MNLQKEISDLQNHELFVAFEEIESFHKTGILRDGFVRTYTQKFADYAKEDFGQFLRLVENHFLMEMAKRFHDSMKI